MNSYIELIGALLVFGGIIASMFWGAPASLIDSSERQLGFVENPQQHRKYRAFTFVAPTLSGSGAIMYIAAAFIG